MGGLSMPNVPIKAEQVKAVIDRHPGALVIGVCFMHMFEKAGWLATVSFDCLIDTNIDPVEVIKTPIRIYCAMTVQGDQGVCKNAWGSLGIPAVLK